MVDLKPHAKGFVVAVTTALLLAEVAGTEASGD